MDGMFGDLFKMLGQQGPDAWFQTATQLALNVARGDDGDPNPQPSERQRLEEFAPLVGRHVDALFGVSSRPEVTAVNRTGLTLAARLLMLLFHADALNQDHFQFRKYLEHFA